MCVPGGCGDAGRDSDPNQVNKDQRSPHASPGHEEGKTSTCVDGVVDVKVGSDSGEADSDRELKCEKGWITVSLLALPIWGGFKALKHIHRVKTPGTCLETRDLAGIQGVRTAAVSCDCAGRTDRLQ